MKFSSEAGHIFMKCVLIKKGCRMQSVPIPKDRKALIQTQITECYYYREHAKLLLPQTLANYTALKAIDRTNDGTLYFKCDKHDSRTFFVLLNTVYIIRVAPKPSNQNSGPFDWFCLLHSH